MCLGKPFLAPVSPHARFEGAKIAFFSCAYEQFCAAFRNQYDRKRLDAYMCAHRNNSESCFICS